MTRFSRLPTILSLSLASSLAVGTTGCKGDDGDGNESGDGDGDGDGPEFNPEAGGVRRLLAHQYRESIRYMLGDSAAEAADPPFDGALFDFQAIGAKELGFEQTTAERYEASATAVADATVADLGALAQHVPCVEAGDASCYEDVAVSLGHIAYRRPLGEDEIATLVGIGEAGQAWGEGDFLAGLKYELMAILQSPHFVYFEEIGTEVTEEERINDNEMNRLSQSELVSRMAFFLMGRTPDLEDLQQAEAGDLATEDAIRDLARDMLDRPEAKVAMYNFFDELLKLSDLDEIGKDTELFPTFTPDVAQLMKQETQLLIEDLVWESDGNFLAFYDAQYTYVNDELAAHYGFDPPGTGEDFARVDFPESEGRKGVFTQGAFLSRFSFPNRNSPTKRGLFVQQKVLCNEIPPPPPGVDTTVPEFDPDDPLTLRDRLVAHMEDDTCSSCHRQVDPIGFAFEDFDAVGKHRTEDNGLPIDPSGDIADLGTWANAHEFADVLRADPKTPQCIVKNLIRGGLGNRVMGPGLVTPVNDADAVFADSDYSMQDLLVELVSSPMFSFVGPAQ